MHLYLKFTVYSTYWNNSFTWIIGELVENVYHLCILIMWLRWLYHPQRVQDRPCCHLPIRQEHNIVSKNYMIIIFIITTPVKVTTGNVTNKTAIAAKRHIPSLTLFWPWLWTWPLDSATDYAHLTFLTLRLKLKTKDCCMVTILDMTLADERKSSKLLMQLSNVCWFYSQTFPLLFAFMSIKLLSLSIYRCINCNRCSSS